MARVEPPVPRWQAPSFPFHPWTWLAIIVGIVVSGPILFIVANLSGQWWVLHRILLPLINPSDAQIAWKLYLNNVFLLMGNIHTNLTDVSLHVYLF